MTVWILGKGMKQSMRKPHVGRRLLFGKKNERDDRGSAIVIVIIAMALISILATTILWASYLNYRIKVNDLKVKNSFYSAETVIEQITAGVKKDIVSASVNDAYQQVLSNWDALGTDDNRENFFLMAYRDQVEEKLGVSGVAPNQKYNRDRFLEEFVDTEFWDTDADNYGVNGYIDMDIWKDPMKPALFKPLEPSGEPPVDANPANDGSMTIKNICVEFYDSDGLLSIINTDIAIDVPKLSFTQAGTIDRLYPYVLVGEEGIETEDGVITITGSIYGGVDEHNEGGIRIGKSSHVTVEDAEYVISGGGIVVGNDPDFINLINQDARLVVRDLSSGGYRTSVYAQDLAVNSSHLAITGKVYVANDLTLSGKGSSVALEGQYLGYGDELDYKPIEETDGEGNKVLVNPAAKSSAIVINGKNSTVDLTGLNTLLLAGRAYVSLSDDDTDVTLPHILMGESISVKSNQIAYLVPPECVGTLDGKTMIGQNPVSFRTWEQMIASLDEYADRDFKIVNAHMEVAKLGGKELQEYGIEDITADDLSGVDKDNLPAVITKLNGAGIHSGVRFYMSDKKQVYLYLVMDEEYSEEYFTAYYNVNSNKTSLDSYFNQYASGGIKLKDNVQGYTVVGNSMVSLTSAASGDNIVTDKYGENLVQLLSSVMPSADEEEGDGEESEEGGQPTDPDVYEEVSDNISGIENIKNQDELDEIIDNCGSVYRNLTTNLMEEDTGLYNTVFENLIMLESPSGEDGSTQGLKDYLNDNGGKAEFYISESPTTKKLKAVLVDAGTGSYEIPHDSNLRLVIAIGDVEVTGNFQGLIIASGKITVGKNVTCKKDGEGVYSALQATSADGNVPANILRNGSGMIKSGYEDAQTDEMGNLRIDYSEIVRYENWIKK